jgi:Ca2+-binding RTX toxin-like protein
MRQPIHKPTVRRLRTRARVAAVTAGTVVLLGLTPLTVSGPAEGAPVGQGFTVTASDLKFILAQIKIAERHAATQTPANPCLTIVGTGPDQIPSPLVSKGLRTVDGSCNNLQPGQGNFGAADQLFPRIGGKNFRDAENASAFGGPASSSYKQKKGNVADSQPRVISNLIVDQTSTNPAAVEAAGHPVRTQGNIGIVPCDTDPGVTPALPDGCTPKNETLFIPNVTTDVGLSPPYNSLFTLFGQFFDHGVDQTVKGGGTVFVPLKADDPLRTRGPDGIAGTGDEVPAQSAFMVLTRAQNQPGPDGILGDTPGTPVDESADDIQDAVNTDSPWVDQSQTYTSHSSHQVFLREYVNDGNARPLSTGKLLGGLGAGLTYPGSPDGTDGISTWASVKKQSAELLGLKLVDLDVLNVPMIATDPYGNFLPGPARGLPQYVGKGADGKVGTADDRLVEGDRADGGVPVPADAVYFDTPFLTDIAHNADPSQRDTNNDGRPDTFPTPDADDAPSADFAGQPAGTYDNEMLDAHFACGDGRCNENIGLSTIHQVFHSEHDRLVDDIKSTLAANPDLQAAYAAVNTFGTGTDARNISFGNGGRLFQAARFVTEMEYQHLVFEEFARKVQPAINPFEPFAFTQTELNPAIKAEFAHAVYRFGHSMLTDLIERRNNDGSANDITLLDGFLNPPEYFNGGDVGTLTPKQAAGSIVMGMSDQAGNELDEFVTETLRNNLLGLPLDLASINMTRARSEGIPPLNVFRRQVWAATNDSAMVPYKSWVDFGENLKHPESLVNFVAAYGTHPSVTGATTVVAKRDAARLLVNPSAEELALCQTTPAECDVPADAPAFLNSIGDYANEGPNSVTGLDSVDLWVGGLAEMTNVFGGLLGSTFNYVFENQLTDLQNGDRLYYLARTPGMNLRTQLEGNSFAELIMRNTDAHTLKADAFATADCKFELSNLAGTPAGFAATGNTVLDDSESDCNEQNLLIRLPDGTIKYRTKNVDDPPGINGQSVYNGTAGVDRIWGGNDSDTFWGNEDNDYLEGGDGADVALGGEGDDIITDTNGDDVPKGGPGNDAIDAGPGLDILMGGEGKDFTFGGANANETFGGDGNDFISLGQSLDAAFGDSGDDYEEGGDQPDLMQGDSGNLFFLDDSQKPGSDILVGQGGDDDYDMEGGDDVGVGGPGIEKVAGASGYDWEIGIGDPQPQDMDLKIPLIPLDILEVGVRDKFNEVEALSGGDLNDVLRGDDAIPAEVGGGGFIGCDALDAAGVARITGLNQLVTTLPRALAPTVTASASKDCPILSGPVWGEGNVLLGGQGDDTIEGRGADDVIDGDRYLNVRLSVRDPNNPATEIGYAVVNKTGQNAMTSQYLRDANGVLVEGSPTLQEAVFNRTVNPGNIVAVKEIVSGNLGTDTAVFSGPLANYTVNVLADRVTVTQNTVTAPQKVSDGVDTLRNVEKLKFSDQTVTFGTPAAPTNVSATATTAATATGSATVTWTRAPAVVPAATSQEIVISSGGNVVRTITGIGAAATTRTINNLTNGTTYTFQVRAVSSIGAGPLSAPSNAVTPRGLPAVPANVQATRGNTIATLAWTQANDGGSPITSYVIQVRTGTTVVRTVTLTGATLGNRTITGLTNGTTYNFRVRAVNALGTSALSAASNNVTPATTPGTPILGAVSSGVAGGAVNATVNWTPPTAATGGNGGLAISGYRIQAFPVNAAGTVVGDPALLTTGAAARSRVVALPAGSYRFAVQAQNNVGYGPLTAMSAVVIAR